MSMARLSQLCAEVHCLPEFGFLHGSNYTQTHHTRYDSSGQVISPRQRPVPDNAQHSQETQMHDPGWIRTRNPSKRKAADPLFIPLKFS